MRIIALVVAIFTTIVFVGSTIATPPGKNVEYAGGGLGKVIFDGKAHAEIKCTDCHPKLFTMKKEARIDMASHHTTDKFCFACHHSKGAKPVATDCAGCHKK